MLASPQNTLVDNIWSHCCMRNSCQRDCSLKLVAWYKVCNKTPNDQPKMIDKRDRQGQNPALSEFDLLQDSPAHTSVWNNKKEITIHKAAIFSELSNCKGVLEVSTPTNNITILKMI